MIRLNAVLFNNLLTFSYLQDVPIIKIIFQVIHSGMATLASFDSSLPTLATLDSIHPET